MALLQGIMVFPRSVRALITSPGADLIAD